MLDHDGVDRGVGEQGEKFSTRAVETRADFGHDPIYRISVRRGPGTHARYLTIEIISLIERGDTGVDGGRATLGHGNFEVANQNHAAHFSCRNGQGPLAKPPIGGLGAYLLHVGPLTQIHYLVVLCGGVTSVGNPVARLYDLGREVLLLGVGHLNNTSLHLAEGRAPAQRPVITEGAPMMVKGSRQWVTYPMLDYDAYDFEQVGVAAAQAGLERSGVVGAVPSRLLSVVPLVDFAATWFGEHYTWRSSSEP
jgi:hypothetical protein